MKTIAEQERHLIERTMALCDGNKVQAALLLGISRKTLERRLKDFATVDNLANPQCPSNRL